MDQSSNYWLICLSQDNFDVAINNSLVGFGEKKSYVIQKMKPKDMVVFYITKETVDANSRRIGVLRGIAEVSSSGFFQTTPIWAPIRGEVFSHRVSIKVINTQASAKIKPIAYDLSFVYSNYGTPLQKGYVCLRPRDWNIIVRAMGVDNLVVDEEEITDIALPAKGKGRGSDKDRSVRRSKEC